MLVNYLVLGIFLTVVLLQFVRADPQIGCDFYDHVTQNAPRIRKSADQQGQ
ncbi:unnamed protein product [Callosobruchus maculatus]|uniref:Uncharacterized protein n=1 Tax=Callosobruchus maculatus TaxID=64391 RepID=A0A653D1A5_CALMS|nr:unnamed protein product [Callosobruchus maculatus]